MMHSTNRRAPAIVLPHDLRTKEAPTLEKMIGQHVDMVTKAIDRLKSGESATKDCLDEFRGEITELAQKMARRGSGGVAVGDAGGDIWGSQLVGSERFKSFASTPVVDRPSRMKFEVKAITSAANSAGAMVEPQRDAYTGLPKRRLTIRNLMRVVNTTTGLVQWPRQTSRDNNAAPVAEMGLKPESSMAFSLENVPIKTIAHWVPASRQILDDEPQLLGIIDDELRYGLAVEEEAQELYGDGTGENLDGIVPTATPYGAPIVVENATMIDQIGMALLQSALTDVEPDGIVMHPSDWLRLLLMKDANGAYLISNPQDRANPRLFGVPVVATKAILQDKFLVGPFYEGATLYDRMAIEVLISTEDRDNFIRNAVTIRAEERIGLAKKRPDSFLYGDFGFIA